MNLLDLEKLGSIADKLDAELLQQLSHELIDSWLLRHKLNYVNYSEKIDIEQFWELADQLDLLARQFLNAESDDQFLDSIMGLKEHAALLFTVLNVRKSDLKDYYLNKLGNFSNSLVKDFDWNVKYSVSSDKFARINQPLCSLSLYLEDRHRSAVQLELTETELDGFIQTLENIQTKVQTYD